MKKKYIFIILIFFLIPLKASASLSPKCYELFEKIKTSSLPNLQNFQNYENSTYGFDPIWILERNNRNEIILDDLGDPTWVLKRDKNNYPLVGRITSSNVINNINYGDKIISIDGKFLNELDDIAINDLLLITEDNNDINSKIEFEKNGKRLILDLEVLTDLQQDDKVRIVISNISDISQVKSTFKADIFLEIEVDFDYDTENLPLGKILFDNLVFKNEQDDWDYRLCENIPHDKILDFNIPNPGNNLKILNSVNMNTNTSETIINIIPYSEKIGDETDYDYTRVISVTNGSYELKNNYDLKTFPFDKQKLVFKIANTDEIDASVIDYKAYTSRALDKYVNEGTLNGWNIKGYEIKNTIFKGPVDENYSGIEVSIEIERKTGYYIYKVIIPILLILFVCWSVVWINPEELESKLTISIVCLLSLIAYNFVIDKELPKLEYLTVLDWIILVSYIYATIPNFLSIYLFRLSKQKNVNKIKRYTYFSKYYGPTSYLILILMIIIINVNLNPETSGQIISWMS